MQILVFDLYHFLSFWKKKTKHLPKSISCKAQVSSIFVCLRKLLLLFYF